MNSNPLLARGFSFDAPDILFLECLIQQRTFLSVARVCGTDAPGPHIGETYDGLAFIASSPYHLERHAAQAQGIGEFRRLFLVDPVDKNACAVGRLRHCFYGCLNHLKHGKEKWQRLWKRAEKNIAANLL